MVRLKDVNETGARAIYYKFQFLMVRLKVDPYAVVVRVDVISIPYGSIKRREIYLVVDLQPEFQFLMVRLKAGITACSGRFFS